MLTQGLLHWRLLLAPTAHSKWIPLLCPTSVGKWENRKWSPLFPISRIEVRFLTGLALLILVHKCMTSQIRIVTAVLCMEVQVMLYAHNCAAAERDWKWGWNQHSREPSCHQVAGSQDLSLFLLKWWEMWFCGHVKRREACKKGWELEVRMQW